MSAAPPVAAPIETKDVGRAAWHTSLRVRCAGAAVLIWIVALAAMTWNTANPDVVNRAQIEESHFVFVGRCEDPAKGTFHVERELKRGELQGPVTVQDLPKQLPPKNTAWVVPVLRHGKSFVVTEGVFPLPPAQVVGPNGVPLEAHVAPKIYPATDDVLRQIDALLRVPPAPPK